MHLGKPLKQTGSLNQWVSPVVGEHGGVVLCHGWSASLNELIPYYCIQFESNNQLIDKTHTTIRLEICSKMYFSLYSFFPPDTFKIFFFYVFLRRIKKHVFLPSVQHSLPEIASACTNYGHSYCCFQKSNNDLKYVQRT